MKQDLDRAAMVGAILLGIGAGAFVLVPSWWGLSTSTEGWSEALLDTWRTWRGPR